MISNDHLNMASAITTKGYFAFSQDYREILIDMAVYNSVRYLTSLLVLLHQRAYQLAWSQSKEVVTLTFCDDLRTPYLLYRTKHLAKSLTYNFTRHDTIYDTQ